jgi:hypothetical protein
VNIVERLGEMMVQAMLALAYLFTDVHAMHSKKRKLSDFTTDDTGSAECSRYVQILTMLICVKSSRNEPVGCERGLLPFASKLTIANLAKQYKRPPCSTLFLSFVGCAAMN